MKTIVIGALAILTIYLSVALIGERAGKRIIQERTERMEQTLQEIDRK